MTVLDSLLALLVIVLVVGAVSWALMSRRGGGTGAKRRPGTWRRRSPWVKRIPVLLMVVALAFLALAFTQFQFLRSNAATGTVVLTMDVSESMSRTDVDPSRLEAAVAAAREFLHGLPTDLRVGLVSFAGAADEVVAPTEDRTAVDGALGTLSRGEGTVIGDGLSTSLDAVEAVWQRDGEAPAAVVLLSDGRDTGSSVAPDEAAARAARLGVSVYTVVLGRTDPTGAGGANAELLRSVAETTGGATFSATSAGGLLEVYRTLQTTLSTELAISDSGALFVAIAAIFALAATISTLLALRSEY